MAIEKAPKHGGRETLAAIGDQAFLDFQQRHVRPAADETQKIVAMGLYSTGTTVSSRPRRRDHTLGFEARHPAHRAGDADPKTLGRRVARHAAFHHRTHNAFAKIVRKRHPRRLLPTATIFKQIKADSGIPPTVQFARRPLVARVIVTSPVDADTAEIIPYLQAKAGYLVAARSTASFERLYEHLANFLAVDPARPNLGAHMRIGIVPPASQSPGAPRP